MPADEYLRHPQLYVPLALVDLQVHCLPLAQAVNETLSPNTMRRISFH